jgi:hypothetical protein
MLKLTECELVLSAMDIWISEDGDNNGLRESEQERKEEKRRGVGRMNRYRKEAVESRITVKESGVKKNQAGKQMSSR